MNFANHSELFHYIYNIINEYRDKYKEKLDLSSFHIKDSKFKVAKRLVNKCDFNLDDKSIIHIEEILNNLSEDELALLYYKNNLFEFNRLDIMKDKMEYIIKNTSVQITKRDESGVPEVILIEDEKIKELKNDIWDFYKIFVFYDYPIFDRVRKSMYIDKKAVLYVDTDSNFLGLNRWIELIKTEILKNKFNKSEADVDFISVSTCTLFLSNVVAGVLRTLCRSMNVTEEYANLLRMKNEFYMEKILFTDKKKRYISNALLQEGQLLGNGLGLPEIKGFDFKKSTVKPFVTEFFTNICLDDILRCKEIKIDVIFRKMMELRKDIEESMKKGENKYFKQANVQIVEHYMNPYSTQGIKGVILWNTLCPDYSLELPIDVDIVPIKDLSDKYVLKWFEEKYPAEYTKLKQNIFSKELYYKKSKAKDSPSKAPSLMNLNYIAKPKNYDKELPPWFSDIVNTDKVINDTLSLFYPILKSLGLKMLTTTKNSEHLSNIVNL